MKRLTLFAVVLCITSVPLWAQNPLSGPVDDLRHPGWDESIFIAGGTSVDSNPSGRDFLFGIRIGRVLTRQRGSGILRGTFEIAADVMPAGEFRIKRTQYAGGIDPLILKWNFTAESRIAPYVALVGGALFSASDLPPGDTAKINFTSGAEFGVQYFRPGGDSLNLSVKPFHLSNASIGNHNPGLNSNLEFLMGYRFR